MSVVLDETAASTPRHIDRGGRRCLRGDCRDAFSRIAVPERRADADTTSAPYWLARVPYRLASPRLGIHTNAVAKDHFAALSRRWTGQCRRRRHGSGTMQTIQWLHASSRAAAQSTPSEGLLFARNPASMRSGCSVAIRGQWAGVECRPRPARLQAPSSRGPEKNAGSLNSRRIYLFSSLTRRGAHPGPAVAIRLGLSLRRGGSRRRFAAECRA